MKTKGLFSILVILTITLSCGSQPGILSSPASTSTPLRLSTLTGPPNISPAFTLTSTTQPTLASTIPATLTNTALPPLPDFPDTLSFGGGGGNTPCEIVPDKPLPVVEGGIAFQNPNWPRMGMLCVWGVPFDTPLYISMIAPDGEAMLYGSVQVQSSTDTVLWFRGNISSASSLAYRVQETTVIFLSLWWPGGVEAGTWPVKVEWAGGETTGNYFAETRMRPEISVIDAQSTTDLIPGRCHQIPSNQPIKVIGENFLPHQLVYMLIYKHKKTDKSDELGDTSFLYAHSVSADEKGLFQVEVDQKLESGQYYSLLGITDPVASLPSGGSISYEDVADAVDCFYVTDSPVNACVGAPPQRMRVDQRGYVCTQGDSVRVRDKPHKLANAVVSLSVGKTFTVIGGPSCADNWSWWQVQTEDDDTGWIAEGRDQTDPYFICPLP